MIYRLGIFATIRSGTTYMVRTMRHCNVHVGHMKLDLEGSVLHDFTKRVNPTQFEHAWHQTRDPLKTISSIAASANMFWRQWQGVIPDFDVDDTPIVKALRYWLWWTRKCERWSTWRYKIEDIRDGSPVWQQICERLGLPATTVFPAQPTDTNTKPHIDLDWARMACDSMELTSKAHDLAVRYGYE